MENMENKKETKMDMKKMSLIAGIVAAVLVVVLIVSIVISSMTGLNQTKKSLDVELGSTTELTLKAEDFFKVEKETAEKIKFDVTEVDLKNIGEYKAYASFEGKKYTIKVNVVDTQAPKVTMQERFIFTNDVTKLTDLTSMVEEVNDASDYTLKLVRFEKKETLKVLNDLELKNLTVGADSFVTEEDALKVGTEDLPTEAGIYRSVLKIEDAEGNASYEEVFVILDTTGALINDVPDQVVEVEKGKLSEAPALDETLYKGVDNVDGEITFGELSTDLVLRDEAKHEWIVKVSYTDRAGNVSNAEFLITVVEKTTNSNSGNGGFSNHPQNNNANSGDKTNTQNKNPGTIYDPRDENKDGYVSTDEEMRYITPEKQACIDAGYGVVVEMDGGKWYAVLTHGDGKVNGKSGSDILREYLTALDLEPSSVGGCWINSEKDWYWWTAEDIHELIGPDDEEYWEW